MTNLHLFFLVSTLLVTSCFTMEANNDDYEMKDLGNTDTYIGVDIDTNNDENINTNIDIYNLAVNSSNKNNPNMIQHNTETRKIVGATPPWCSVIRTTGGDIDS